MNSHRWSYCPHCMAVMVICGHCGNNTCNGGSGEKCPDQCASAREWEGAKMPPVDLQFRERRERDEWAAMTQEQRQFRAQALFDEAFP